MAHNSYNIHYAEKMFWGNTEVYILQKMIFEPYQWNASPLGKGAHLVYHITTPTIDEKHTQTEDMWKYQYEDRYNHLKLQICIKTIKKCTVHMPHNCWQMNDVEKICIGAIEHYMYCKKDL